MFSFCEHHFACSMVGGIVVIVVRIDVHKGGFVLDWVLRNFAQDWTMDKDIVWWQTFREQRRSRTCCKKVKLALIWEIAENDSFDIQNLASRERWSLSFENFYFKIRLSKSKVISLDIRRDNIFFRLSLNICSLLEIVWYFHDVSPSKGCEFSFGYTSEPSSRTSSKPSGTVDCLCKLTVEHDENGHTDEMIEIDYNCPIKFLLSWWLMNFIIIFLLLVKKSDSCSEKRK
jgi:hypothetical protein